MRCYLDVVQCVPLWEWVQAHVWCMAILLNYWGAGRSTCNKLQHAFEQQLALAVMKLLVLLLGFCWLATDLPPSIHVKA